MGKIVDWCASSYQDIQDANPQWNFLRNDFSFQTIAAVSAYLPSAVSLTEHGSWKEDSMRAYLASTSDEQELGRMTWDDMRKYRLFGPIQSGKPWEVAVKPDKSLVFYPTPDAIYTVYGEYWKRPQVMSANSDEPVFPAQFHMLIVWGAVRYYAGDQGAAELYALADQNYRHMMRSLIAYDLPELECGGTLT